MSYVKTSVGYRRRSKRSRVRKRRVFAFLGFVTVVTLAIWLWNDGHSRGASRSIAATPPAAPKSVARAVLSPPWTNRERFALGTALHDAFVPALAGAHQWSLAVLGGDGFLVYEDSSRRAVAPASVQKLIVAASALDALGAKYRFHTIFTAQATPTGGTLDGNLWLVGSGDPSLQSSDLRNGIAVLSRGGVHRINGAVVVDATAQTGPGRNPHWGLDDEGQDYAAPTSAISVDGDTIESHETVRGVDQTALDADDRRFTIRRGADESAARCAGDRLGRAAGPRCRTARQRRSLGSQVRAAGRTRIPHALRFR